MAENFEYGSQSENQTVRGALWYHTHTEGHQKEEETSHSVHTGGRSGGGGGGLLLLHAAWRHGARIEEPPPPCRLSEPIWLSVIFYYTLSNWPDTRHGGGGSSILAPCRQAAWRSKFPPPPPPPSPPLRPPVWTLWSHSLGTKLPINGLSKAFRP